MTEAALGETLFLTLFAASPAPFLILQSDAPRFTITDVNDAYLAVTLMKRNELVGRGIFEAFPGNPGDTSVSILGASLDRVLASKQTDSVPEFKYDLVHPDGSFEERWWKPVNSPVIDANGEVRLIIHNANEVTAEHRTAVERAGAEAALRESEERFRALATTGNAFFYRMSPDWRQVLQLDSNDFVAPLEDSGTNWLSTNVHEEDRERVAAAVAQSIATRSAFELEHRIPLPDGGVGWIISRAVPLLDDKGEIREWFGTVTDITARKNGEEALRESEKIRRLALDHGRMGAWSWDTARDRIRGDASFMAIYGFPASDEAFPLSRFTAQMDREATVACEKVAARALLPGEEFEGDLALAAGPTAGRWVRWRGRAEVDVPGVIRGVSFDVTERRRAEAELRYRGAQLETLVQQAPIGVYLVDADFCLAQVNAVARPVFGDIPDLIGRDFDEVIHVLWEKRYADELTHLFRHTMETGEPYATPERAEFRADRAIVEYYSWRIDRITLPDGRHGVVCYFSDISEQVRARLAIAESEHKYRSLSESLQTADVRKNEFIATLAHELRNPLAPLRTGLSILASTGDTSANAVRAREVMDRQLTQLVRLVDDLLDVSRVSRGEVVLQMSVHSLQSVVDLALETSRPLLDKGGHQLRVDLPPEPVLLTADATRIAQVLSNILNNAAKYTPDEGQLRLRAQRTASDRLRLEVEDNGTGIPPDMLESVFDMFTQVDPANRLSQGGLGIGLSLSRRLVELHGGTLRASSGGLGQGSTFTVELPAMPQLQPADLPQRNGTAEVVPEVVRKSVLVVDDNVDVAEMLTMVLRLDGHEVRVVHTGNDALASFGDDEAPDIVFLDIGLPDRSGYEVAGELRRRRSFNRSVLVALTGWGAESDQRRAREAGFDLHLTKPVSSDALSTALATSRSPASQPTGPEHPYNEADGPQ